MNIYSRQVFNFKLFRIQLDLATDSDFVSIFDIILADLWAAANKLVFFENNIPMVHLDILSAHFPVLDWNYVSLSHGANLTCNLSPMRIVDVLNGDADDTIQIRLIMLILALPYFEFLLWLIDQWELRFPMNPLTTISRYIWVLEKVELLFIGNLQGVASFQLCKFHKTIHRPPNPLNFLCKPSQTGRQIRCFDFFQWRMR